MGYPVYLKEIRKKRNLTVAELAERVGTTEASISRYATGSRKKAFAIASLTGLADPWGAILGYLLLMPLIKTVPATLPVIHASVAGIMVFVTFDGLLPMAQKFGRPHLTLYGIISGMFLMALALAFL